VLAPTWLLGLGIVVGLIARVIAGGRAYGLVADALLGITGAFAADWILQAGTHAELSWATVTLLTIWGAAALPLLAHLLAGRQTARRAHGSIPGR
jgi:uncharacterized membrane protein YeaQ/YmgE (transglycosylase-associated protein family)